MAMLQLRSGLLPGTSEKFCEDLVSWCVEQKMAQIVCLTSSLAHERQESQLTGSDIILP